ncbi:hypothetical protein L3Q82_014705, partial [Scortum barcoo]
MFMDLCQKKVACSLWVGSEILPSGGGVQVSRDLVRMLPVHLPLEVFQVHPTGKRPWGRPKTRWRDYKSHLPWECLGIPPKELERVLLERGMSGLPCSACCLHNLWMLD